MSNFLDGRYVVDKDLISSDVGDEMVLLLPSTNMYFGLDAMGAMMFNLLRQSARPREIAAEIAQLFDQPVDNVERDLSEFVASLLGVGLILPLERSASVE